MSDKDEKEEGEGVREEDSPVPPPMSPTILHPSRCTKGEGAREQESSGPPQLSPTTFQASRRNPKVACYNNTGMCGKHYFKLRQEERFSPFTCLSCAVSKQTCYYCGFT